MRPLILIALIILGLFAYKTYFLDAEEGPKEAPSTEAAPAKPSTNGLPVDIYVAKKVNKSNIVFASGTVVPNEEVEIRSEVSGRLIQLNINEGGYIKKGAVIAKLNDADLKSQLKKLAYEEQLAEQTAARQQKLLKINAISKEEYDMAVNKVNTLSADKEFLEVQLEKTTLHAPFSGRMGLKNISEGAYITPNVVISKLVQSNPVKLDFSIPEKYANRINSGQEITFTIDGDDERVTAKVIALDPVIDEDLRTLRVRAKASNPRGKYLPGMFIKVELPLGEESSIMVPTESIIPILKGKKVFVMKNGIANEVLIKTGLRTDTHVQVEDGLEVGDSIVVSALMSVKNDMPISVRAVL